MSTQSQTIVTRRQIIFWIASSCVLFVVALLWTQPSLYHRSSDRPLCILHQRNLQQAIRSYANMEGLKPGDPLDWSKIIGPGLFLESKPACPVHGESAYAYSPVIPEPGTRHPRRALPGSGAPAGRHEGLVEWTTRQL